MPLAPDATPHSSLQHNQLLPEGGIFRFKSALGLDECRQQVEGQEDQRDHPRKRDVIHHQFNADEVFGTHRFGRVAKVP